jgi:hypothetical protein
MTSLIWQDRILIGLRLVLRCQVLVYCRPFGLVGQDNLRGRVRRQQLTVEGWL